MSVLILASSSAMAGRNTTAILWLGPTNALADVASEIKDGKAVILCGVQVPQALKSLGSDYKLLIQVRETLNMTNVDVASENTLPQQSCSVVWGR